MLIETNDVIEVARKMAATNGYADRIEFIQDMSHQDKPPSSQTSWSPTPRFVTAKQRKSNIHYGCPEQIIGPCGQLDSTA